VSLSGQLVASIFGTYLSLFKDSAEWYENERECGQAILDFCANHNIPRTSIFYTSKLKNNNGYERVRRAIDKSVKDCGLGYIDLYLVHGPIGGPRARMDSWKAICEAQKEGKIKSIGVSNFGVRHMKELVESDSVDLPIPAVNQVRWLVISDASTIYQ